MEDGGWRSVTTLSIFPYKPCGFLLALAGSTVSVSCTGAIEGGAPDTSAPLNGFVPSM
jgi:hypothetical protein